MGKCILLGVALTCLLIGCGDRTRIDAEWHRRDLIEGLLTHWLEVAPTDTGFMRTAVDRRWKPSVEQPGYLTEHARLVYSMIIGYEITKDKRYLDAANRGADFLLTSFRDPLHGGYFLRVAPDGKVIAAAKNTYGHAFTLLALSHMARVTGEGRFRAAALQTWQEIDASLRNPKGGFRGELPRNFLQPQDESGEQGHENLRQPAVGQRRADQDSAQPGQRAGNRHIARQYQPLAPQVGEAVLERAWRIGGSAVVHSDKVVSRPRSAR